MARKKRNTPEINAGSMADIAFLLLIFFLVTTTMDTDTGLRALLPPMPENVEPPDVNKRNVFEIRINSGNQLLVEGEIIDISQLTEQTVKFITNNGRDPKSSDNPRKAIVSLQNDRGTDYDIYVQVQDRLRLAYNKVRDRAAQAKYGRDYKSLTDSEQKIIREEYPQKISEAEPKDIGGTQ